MRILQISDTHLGITTDGELKVMFREAAKEDFDVIVHCGDWSGQLYAAPTVRETLRLMRKYLHDSKPIVATLGNHDYWCNPHRRGGVVTLADHQANISRIRSIFTEYGVHYLDDDGVYTEGKVHILGSIGWYATPYPSTNDRLHIPNYIGDTEAGRYISHTSEQSTMDSLDIYQAIRQDGDVLVYVSHFPVIDVGGDAHFKDFGGRTSLGDLIREDYGCSYFLNGHSHQRHEGPLRWEAGPDYRKPRYQVIEIK